MNKKFKNIDIENILFFDIETVRREKELKVDSPLYDLFQWKMRNKDTDELPEHLETVELYNRKGALYPVYNKIVCISVGFVKDSKVRIKSLVGEEDTIIAQFCEISSSFSMLCGFNILYFDLPQIMIAGSKYYDMSELLKDSFNPSGKKPWNLENSIVELMDVFKGTGYINNSLSEVCYHFGVPTPKDDINGSDVSKVYWEEKDGLKRIATYCNKDVFASINIFRAMRKEALFETFEDKSALEDVESVNMLQRLMKSQLLDKKFITWLEQKKKGLNEEQLGALKEMVKAHYLIIKGAVKDNKVREEEIEKLCRSKIGRTC